MPTCRNGSSPWTAYKARVSPFVTFLGVLGIGTAMNVVVLTAALSSPNSGLYSTGRVLRSLAMGGSAPPFVAKMNAQKVPYGGILVTLAVYLLGVVLNYLLPSQVFEIVPNVASLGIVSTWGFIVVCQMMLRRSINRGETAPIAFRMPFASFASWLTLAFLLGVLVLMAFDHPDGTYTIAAIPFVAVLLWVGWLVMKGSSPFSSTIPSYQLTHIMKRIRITTCGDGEVLPEGAPTGLFQCSNRLVRGVGAGIREPAGGSAPPCHPAAQIRLTAPNAAKQARWDAGATDPAACA